MREFRVGLLVLLIAAALFGVYSYDPSSFEKNAKVSTGAMFVGPDREFYCSGTEIGKTSDGDGVFLTARHCVADADTNKLSEDIKISFSNDEGGPFYDAKPIAISLTDDLALLLIRNGGDIPVVRIKDERSLHSGAEIFNVSFPLSTGRQVFHGEYLNPNFASVPDRIIESYPFWIHAMPIDVTLAPGSSGSGVFSESKRALIGVAVGTFESGRYNIVIPADRVTDFLNDLQDNTVDKFVYLNPQKIDIEKEY
jgi:S1-C subfamily serine protease